MPRERPTPQPRCGAVVRSEPKSIFVVTLEATYRQLRWWMKRAGREYGVKIIDLREAEITPKASDNFSRRGQR